ncbi:hypothetical protein [Lysinibacillus endophyticus]|uniref:HicB-like antitoxin of toxin-antitoxin system domain-containing protein n=1 Tax=Ureibacillus endophyticus TaxID=1978490 RepID=A0A494YUN6_9BACL|nr:hypothetical protein [Lysinibacillus endophyticus]MCP1144356.1 hypothetical protein [Lysinibacillus endophyticus]RKQ13864.1 hypothetical protein D8M03_15140 [Lysinibacillus endophyticus]
MIKIYEYPVIFAVEDQTTEEGDFPVYIRIPDLMDAGFNLASSSSHTEDDIISIARDCMKIAIQDGLRRDLHMPVPSKLREIDLKKHLYLYEEESIELRSIAIEWIKTEI